jgi:hypothetical protein
VLLQVPRLLAASCGGAQARSHRRHLHTPSTAVSTAVLFSATAPHLKPTSGMPRSRGCVRGFLLCQNMQSYAPEATHLLERCQPAGLPLQPTLLLRQVGRAGSTGVPAGVQPDVPRGGWRQMPSLQAGACNGAQVTAH